jgi:hypothetical protein
LIEKTFPEHQGEAVNLIFDTTYFCKELGTMIFRANSQNLYWKHILNETVADYEEGLKKVSQSYYFLSFTIDGRKGVIQMLEKEFPGTPIQLCIFHQIKTINKYITKKPKTECGKSLRKLILSLKDTKREIFEKKFNDIQDLYSNFLKEKNNNNEFVHKKLRSAIRSIKTNINYLFTHEEFPDLKIPKTTNSCDGYFSHLKSKVKLHRGISLGRKKLLIDKLLSE